MSIKRNTRGHSKSVIKYSSFSQHEHIKVMASLQSPIQNVLSVDTPRIACSMQRYHTGVSPSYALGRGNFGLVFKSTYKGNIYFLVK